MQHASTYCQTRRTLESRCWDLVERLFLETTRLVRTAGGDHDKFARTKRDCVDTRTEVETARDQLAAHRTEHGC